MSITSSGSHAWSPNDSSSPDTAQAEGEPGSEAHKIMQLDTDVFTFVTVYYKYAEWGTQYFDTLHEGLVYYARDYGDGLQRAEREELLNLDDDALLDRVLDMGMLSKKFHNRLLTQVAIVYQDMTELNNRLDMDW